MTTTNWSEPTDKTTNWAFDPGYYLYGGSGGVRYTYGQHLRLGGANAETRINTSWSNPT